MIVVTGAAGFIGSCMVRRLLDAGYEDVLVVDDFGRPDKNRNLEGKKIWGEVHRNNFIRWFERNHADVDAVIHLGARTDTTEMDTRIFDELNLEYSKAVWMMCCAFDKPLLYASSAATYGLGELGYTDDHSLIPQLKPLNPYGQSKQDFDVWVLQQIAAGVAPPHWAGFKFFNVYGPNEYHKGRMASVVFHAYNQISATKSMNLFRSHRAEYADGGQLRDFIYVKDVVRLCIWLMENRKVTGLFNLGTGQARTFNDLAKGVFKAMELPAQITFVDTPKDIRDKYQYFTEAKMEKLKKAGYPHAFTSLEAGIHAYVTEFLNTTKYF